MTGPKRAVSDTWLYAILAYIHHKMKAERMRWWLHRNPSAADLPQKRTLCDRTEQAALSMAQQMRDWAGKYPNATELVAALNWELQQVDESVTDMMKTEQRSAG